MRLSSPTALSTLPVLTILAGTGLACAGDAAPSPIRGAEFDDVFDRVGSIRLEEPPGEPANLIVDVTALTIAPDGRLAVVDRKGSRVRIYGPDSGELLKSLGGFGDGPGEFRAPADATFDADGRLYVVDVDNPRLTRFDRELRFDTLYAVPGYFAYGVEPLGDGNLLLTTAGGRSPWLVTVTRDGEVLDSFHPVDSIVFDVPYWQSIAKVDVAVADDIIYAATNLLYPIDRYAMTGEPVAAFGDPPESWVEPLRPESGQFAGRSIQSFNEWLRSFSVVDNVALYGDSLVLIAHGEYGRNRLTVNHTALDVYDASGRKIYEDVAMRGRLLHSGDHVYLLTGGPPGPWTLEEFRLMAVPRQ